MNKVVMFTPWDMTQPLNRTALQIEYHHCKILQQVFNCHDRKQISGLQGPCWEQSCLHEEGHLWSKGGVSCDDRHAGYTVIHLSNWTVGLMNFISYILSLNKNDF